MHQFIITQLVGFIYLDVIISSVSYIVKYKVNADYRNGKTVRTNTHIKTYLNPTLYLHYLID